MLLTDRNKRILYVLAKNGGPVRKRTICHATPKWQEHQRASALRELEIAGLIKSQETPGAHQRRAGVYYWLTPTGVENVDNLEAAGELRPLPADWRENYADTATVE